MDISDARRAYKPATDEPVSKLARQASGRSDRPAEVQPHIRGGDLPLQRAWNDSAVATATGWHEPPSDCPAASEYRQRLTDNRQLYSPPMVIPSSLPFGRLSSVNWG